MTGVMDDGEDQADAHTPLVPSGQRRVATAACFLVLHLGTGLVKLGTVSRVSPAGCGYRDEGANWSRRQWRCHRWERCFCLAAVGRELL